jgi:hypothetical protein
MALAHTIRFRNQLAAFWRFCLSFRKHDWELNDYPLVIREHKLDPDFIAPRFTQHRYIAYIVNWALTGGGDTPQDAVDDLRVKFQSIKSKWKIEGTPPLRPGKVRPVESASQEKIGINQELSEDFIRRVLDLDWAWISDESSLWDFHTDETNDQLFARIFEVYGVDVSDIESAKLYEILDRIQAKKGLS